MLYLSFVNKGKYSVKCRKCTETTTSYRLFYTVGYEYQIRTQGGFTL